MSNTIKTKAQVPFVRFLAAILVVVLMVMVFPAKARAEFDLAVANSLKIPFIQLAPSNMTEQLQFRDSLHYKSPYLGNVIAHVMDVAGDDRQFGVGFCGNHNLKLGSENVNSDNWIYAGVWTPNGSYPFLDYYYDVCFESDLVREENPGQTNDWYAQTLNTYEWGYAKYCTPEQRYALNTLVQIAVWLDRTGKLGNLPSEETLGNGWSAVKQTKWYKVLAKEMKAYCKAFGSEATTTKIDDTLCMILDNYYSKDNADRVLVYEYLHETKPYTYQPLLVLWYK